jgi:cell wall-associated NlpC family hydrolase
MPWFRVLLCATALVIAASAAIPVAYAVDDKTPAWAKPAIRYLDEYGYLDKKDFRPNASMSRKSFKSLMRKAFGRGYFTRTDGRVTAGEVSNALVKALGRKAIARALSEAQTPDGWEPETPQHFGTEVIARELSLRHDRPTTEDLFEASSEELMAQADIAWAVWKAKTGATLYSADALSDFELSKYGAVRREVVQYAMSLVGTPYVWAGEWPKATPDGYPYGPQVHGGFDCSGFVWYVLRAKTSSWKPIDRPYRGWALTERSSDDMARAAEDRLRYREFRPGDVIFFSPDGRKTKASKIYHAALYLGRGWIIHSSGSRAGVSIAAISPGSWWHDEIAWGRRVITN